MATQPHPTPSPKPAPPPPKPDEEDTAAAAPKASPPPEPPAETVADEQRARSAEIEAEGVEAWKAKHDQRTEAEKQPQAVAGVAPTSATSAQTEAGSWAGSTRSTPEARKAQNRQAP